ncbi:MAG: OmpA family protein [Ferruginibacter sp.]
MQRLHLFIILLIVSGLCSAQTKDTLTLHFDFNNHSLTPEAKSKLDAFVGKISGSRVGSINLRGYCDSKGSNAYNDALSLKRVNAVKVYLQKIIDITALSVTAKGFGENGLLNSDITNEESHQNRRVEIIALIQEPGDEIPMIQKESRSLTKMMEDSSLKTGSVITLPNLQFYNNSDVLLPQSVPTLKELFDIMMKNPKLKIIVEGHICCVPQVEGIPFNELPSFNISLLRAKMVYNKLIKSGLGENRLVYRGFGSSQPLYPIPERTEAERVANRRVEIRIVDK